MAFANAITAANDAAVLTHDLAIAATAQASGQKPNILVIFGDDTGVTHISAHSFNRAAEKAPKSFLATAIQSLRS